MDYWVGGLRMMVYLQPNTNHQQQTETAANISNILLVDKITFISKQEAMEIMKEQIQPDLLEGLQENPLPDAFEVSLYKYSENPTQFENIARQIRNMPLVAEVEYGQQWLNRFAELFSLFEVSGYALGGLLCMAVIFFVGNTIRLVIYNRREEIEIMRLVGASEGFIRMPLYVLSIFQGTIGGLVGMTGLITAFTLLSASVDAHFPSEIFKLRFINPLTFIKILIGSMVIGWLGCYLALRQFLKL